ncbi:MAG: threonine synthase [Clostridia bacterium]|nr:threonine synthase [Clostridia bacterium]
MKYCSTRDSAHLVTDAQAIVSGLAPDGGLYVPTDIPALTLADIKSLCACSYAERAADIMARFLPSFTYAELLGFAQRAYAGDKFPPLAAPVVPLSDTAHILELFHGPTCAFKDFALQMLPYLLTSSMRKTGVTDRVCILVATSGDTGKAALCGFADVAGASICVFYPDGGVSNMQRLQMVTQSGKNVMVCAINGNFDDTQNAVKRIFADTSFAASLKARDVRLSSANSINWGRLVPQIAYYVSGYCELINQGVVTPGDAINACVPTGNFGDILAAWFAKRMGLPLKTLICASNSNNVLTDFLETGMYDRNRPFHYTTSPSMDILISSNLERLLYLLSGSDTEVAGYMAQLASDARYTVSPALFDAIRKDFACGFCGDAEAASTIAATFREGYLPDTHTAVALNVYEAYKKRTGDLTQTLVVSTASPFKFPASVLKALGQPVAGGDFQVLDRLSAIAGQPVPLQLDELRNKRERFSDTVPPEVIRIAVDRFVNAQLEGNA